MKEKATGKISASVTSSQKLRHLPLRYYAKPCRTSQRDTRSRCRKAIRLRRYWPQRGASQVESTSIHRVVALGDATENARVLRKAPVRPSLLLLRWNLASKRLSRLLARSAGAGRKMIKDSSSERLVTTDLQTQESASMHKEMMVASH
jgi:hypothetical protein